MARQQRFPLHTKVRADLILQALARRHKDDLFLTEVKSGSTWFNENLLRVDALAIKRSWASPCITAYEVKVDRSDFRGDTKWGAYLQLCHCFYFACPAGLIQAEELPPEVGLVWYNPETGGLYTRRKAVYRPIELPVEMLYYIILDRLESDHHPFFSSRREYLEAWVQDREDRRRLGEMVRTRLAQRLAAAEAEIEVLRDKIAHLERQEERYHRLLNILREFGVDTWAWNVEESLRKTLSSRIPRGALGGIKRIRREAEKLLQMLESLGEPPGDEAGEAGDEP